MPVTTEASTTTDKEGSGHKAQKPLFLSLKHSFEFFNTIVLVGKERRTMEKQLVLFLEEYAKTHKEIELYYSCGLVLVEFPKAEKGYGVYNIETMDSLFDLYDLVSYEVRTLNAKILNGHKSLVETRNMLDELRNHLAPYVE